MKSKSNSRSNRKKSEPRSSGQQQQAASGEGRQYGEGNYKATREYNAGVKRHMQGHDVEREARDAAPRNEAEQREMDQAERIGRSHARDSQDGDEDMQKK